MEEATPIIVINGSYMIKSGFNGDCAPRGVYPSILGVKKFKTLEEGSKDFYIGDEAHVKRGILKIQNIFSKGRVVDFNNYEKLLEHNYSNELRVDPSEHSQIFSEALDTPKEEREKVAQLVFEKFQIPSFFVGFDSTYCLYAAGRTNGVVLDSGSQVTTTVALYDGVIQSGTVQHHKVSGDNISEYLTDLIEKKKEHKISKYVYTDIKENVCEVATDFDQAVKDDVKKEFELPDGKVISLGIERILAPELLFKPSLFNIVEESITQKILKSIEKSNSIFHKYLCGNILITGGNTMFEGFYKRIELELDGSVKEAVKVICPPERKFSSWIGASILSSLSSFKEQSLTKDEFNEKGSKSVESKFPCTFDFSNNKK